MIRPARRYTLTLFAMAVSSAAMAAPSEKSAGTPGGAYRASEFDLAISLAVGSNSLESKLATCLSLYERYQLYRIGDDRKRANVIFDILKIDLKLTDIAILKSFFNVPGHEEGNEKAARLFSHILKRTGTPADCLIVADLLREDVGEQVAYEAYRGLNKHLKNVRRYVNRGGTMPDAERSLFQSESFIRCLAEGLEGKKTKSTAKSCLTAIEEPALLYLEKWNDDLPVSKAILEIKRAIQSRLKRYPDSTWDSAFGRTSIPAPNP